jgi:hypothetical protein
MFDGVRRRHLGVRRFRANARQEIKGLRGS